LKTYKKKDIRARVKRHADQLAKDKKEKEQQIERSEKELRQVGEEILA